MLVSKACAATLRCLRLDLAGRATTGVKDLCRRAIVDCILTNKDWSELEGRDKKVDSRVCK
jgi:hypothetical protein